jgi:hypothetical protein
MRTTIDYGVYTSEEEKHEAAIRDIKEYMTSAQYARLTAQIKSCQPPMTYSQFLFACGLAGIEGYPVKAWAKECGIKPLLNKTKLKSASGVEVDVYECTQCNSMYDPLSVEDEIIADMCPNDACPSNAVDNPVAAQNAEYEMHSANAQPDDVTPADYGALTIGLLKPQAH